MSPAQYAAQPRCGEPSPGGTLRCVHPPHGIEQGHLWLHESTPDAEPTTTTQQS